MMIAIFLKLKYSKIYFLEIMTQSDIQPQPGRKRNGDIVGRYSENKTYFHHFTERKDLKMIEKK